MANIDRIANVAIALQDAGVTQQSYSDMIVVGVHTLTTNRVLVITDPSALTQLGMSTTDPIYLAVSDAFSQIPSVPQVYIGRRVAGETPDVTLAACMAENNSWYGIILTSRVPADILAAAAWAEANTKLFGTAVAEVGAYSASSTSDTLANLQTQNYFRTFGFYHAAAANDFPDAALMANKFTIYPGGETWANATLAGVSTDPLTDTQSAAVLAKNGNTFEPFSNLTLTQGGKVAAGEWIDVIRFRDWLANEVATEVFDLFVNSRVPYTDLGIRSVKSKIQSSLDLGQRRGGIAPDELDDNGKAIPGYTISVPLSADVSQSDKSARTLNDVTFTARLAGAIHAVQINGVLSYTLG